ncbi:MAG: carboxypeptidase-like regulatory domain-containing protein [Ignavibacteriales bacterium]|nr:carboxypeptidase-like regulatory domain-containing protein [Ignavibacteriales bacterium]
MKVLVKFAKTAVPVVLALLLSCKSEGPTGPGANSGVMSGQVTQAGSSTPIAGAAIALTIQGQAYNAVSNSTGGYSITVAFSDTLAVSGTVTVSVTGYQNLTQSVTLTPRQTTNINFALSLNTAPVPPPPPGGGYANTLTYVGPTNMNLSVFGVGGTESGILTFEARDSLGQPIQPARADTIAFSISGVPVTGGAYTTPTFALTNTSARASTAVQSGTVAGAIQVVASLTRDTDGVIVRSTPVKVLIHGGLPDQTHFGLGANPFNIPGLHYLGRSSVITALVGDKYGNPVAPGTAVYFGNPTQGLITTSTGYTTNDGFASVTLYTGVNHASNGRGFVYAETLGENNVAVRDTIEVVFSGYAFITNLSAGGPLVVNNTTSALVTFTVADENGNPLAAGTGISATVEGTGSAVVSKVSPTSSLDDVISTFWTNFSVTVSKNLQASPATTGPFTLTITASGPNGEATATLQGTVN